MLNTVSLNAVNNSKFSQRFVKPLFGSYCFANIPQTIESLLIGQENVETGHVPALPPDVFTGIPTKYNKVILFFIDGFGWRFFEQGVDKHPLLKTLLTH